MLENKRNLVFWGENSLAPKGGPSAVCFYYNKERKYRNDNYFCFLPDLSANVELHAKERKYISKLPKFIRKIYELIKLIIKTNTLLGGKYPHPFFDFSQYDLVHFHDTESMYVRRKELDDYKGIVLLQSHTPQPKSHEMYDNLPKIIRFFVPKIKKRFEIMDKYAFERADYILFPCPEAEEPYYNGWKGYKYIHDQKSDKYRYILTGIPECKPIRSRKDILTELRINENSFIVSYVGRHNVVKGYDSLKRIASMYLECSSNVYFICAGKEEPLKRLEHPKWIEIGWTNDAHSYISASDVFVLPNRETYFDIVMLEVLSLGKIVVASRTGGNRYFEKEGCEGVFLYDTEEEAVNLLKRIEAMSGIERKTLGEKNKKFYQKNHTVEAMYDSYISLLSEIHKEAQLWQDQ